MDEQIKIMEEHIRQLREKCLNLAEELVNVNKKCDNYEERIAKLESGEESTGIYLDGVQDYYKAEILKQLKGNERR